MWRWTCAFPRRGGCARCRSSLTPGGSTPSTRCGTSAAGRVYTIDQVRDVCRRAADVGGVGDRYTCLIQGRERYLWFEKGRWFVEAFSE